MKQAQAKLADEINASIASYRSKGIAPEEMMRFAMDDHYYILIPDRIK